MESKHISGPSSLPQPIDKRDDEKTMLPQYEDVFNMRPEGLDKKAAWLQNLEERHGEIWYKHFFDWYMKKLSYRPNGDYLVYTKERGCLGYHAFCYFLSTFKLQGIDDLSWQPTNPRARLITKTLAYPCLNNTPYIYIGRYNGYIIGLVLHGSALDLPTVDIETFDSLGVQYRHLNMFAGLRIEGSSKEELCVLTLGKLLASATELRTVT